LSLDLSWVEIDRGRLAENVRAFRSALEPGARLMTVVKSNAYGHGLALVSEALRDEVDWFGVDSLTEAQKVAAAAPGKPLLILGASSPAQAPAIVGQAFRQVVYRNDTVLALSEAARDAGTAARIHLKIETGTNRQGIPLEDAVRFATEAARRPGIEIEGVYTHFSNIEDTLDPSFALLQVRRFREALDHLAAAGIRPPEVHAAATAGILLYPETHFSMVRLGIGAYGLWPSRETRLAAREKGRALHLLPVMTWKTRIVQLKDVPAGDFVGYGRAFEATRPMRLAVIPVGYYEGYDRKLSGTGRALVGGRHVPVVGRVAMNMTMLDVTGLDAALADEVVLLGSQGDQTVSADELAEKIGTIAYEVVARVNPLLERRPAGNL
jgi:alanine racemase